MTISGGDGLRVLSPGPKPAGHWVMPGSLVGAPRITFRAFKRPRWLTRVMMRLVFEWQWEDYLDLDKSSSKPPAARHKHSRM